MLSRPAHRFMAAAVVLAVSLLAGLGTQPAPAQSVADFYKGKSITMIVGGSEGGGYDTMARAIGRHIGRHVPGNPSIVVRNMPGASGMAATNHLFNVAPRDGTVIGMVSRNMPDAAIMKLRNTRFELSYYGPQNGPRRSEQPQNLVYRVLRLLFHLP